MWGALRLLVALLAASPFGPIFTIDARASEFPTNKAHVCAPDADEDVLFAEIPDEATVQDLIFLGSAALAGLGKDGTPQRRVTIRPGDTFVELLGLYKVPPPEALEWYAAAHRAFDLRKLRPGQTLTLTFEPNDRLVGLEYEIDSLHVLLAERDLDGKLLARREELPTTTEVHGVAGTIASNMTSDCLKAGVPRKVVSGIEGIFSSKVRFGRLRKGDTFRVLYEVKVGPDGKEVRGADRILAAEVQTNGVVHTALQAERTDGKQVYLDLQGKPLVQEAANRLGYPLKFTRISSRFSSSRLHPILRRRRPHYGVDFAAPRGTPVRAIADGRVVFARWEGQLGRAVRIEHSSPAGFDSIYGHLSGFARGVRNGARVSRGDVIGYVGSTGLATGPHLHFGLVRGEHYVDPLEALQTVQVQAARYDGKKFERRKAVLKGALETLDHAGPVRLTRMSDTLDL